MAPSASSEALKTSEDAAAAETEAPATPCDPKEAGEAATTRPAAEDDETGLRAPSEECSDASEEGERRKHEVWLHVYDLDSMTKTLNEFVLKQANLGAFHCGVEVLDYEWFFAWGDSDEPGIVFHSPRAHEVHIYRESVCMGETPFSEREIDKVICDLMDAWPSNSYHPISRNCITFAEEFTRMLEVPEPFPPWIRGAADVGKSPALYPIADYGWQWLKWWCTQPAQVAEAERDEDPVGLPHTPSNLGR
eukprot:TRINITY_DN55595_c0_g1_i1.p1 TRINITY_DN55595_c0_g1~~TRINITY_DN55595_c0_g1_i1.p1  ORF type:complete len:249 (-),score=54.73 TRINITY_DN55595_c0_g1_i1:26-772(-)